MHTCFAQKAALTLLAMLAFACQGKSNDDGLFAGAGTSGETGSEGGTIANAGTHAQPGGNGGTGGSGGTDSGTGGTDSGSGGITGASGTCATSEVQRIFGTSCTQGGCHGSRNPAAGLDLSRLDPAAALLNVGATLCSDWVLVAGGSLDRSLLWQKLTQVTPPCGSPMPIGAPLVAADQACIAAWIETLGTGPRDCETCGGTTCVDLETDVSHCGGCGQTCAEGQTCDQGQCRGCPPGTTVCSGTCVDVAMASEHCGGCGQACSIGTRCAEGKCVCDATDSVVFNQDIAPLLQQSCTGNGCHSGRRPQQALDLSLGASYDEIVGVAADQCSDGRKLVEPGSPATSYLLQKIAGIEICSGTLMPKSAPAWSANQIQLLSNWICSGAPR